MTFEVTIIGKCDDGQSYIRGADVEDAVGLEKLRTEMFDELDMRYHAEIRWAKPHSKTEPLLLSWNCKQQDWKLYPKNIKRALAN